MHSLIMSTTPPQGALSASDDVISLSSMSDMGDSVTSDSMQDTVQVAAPNAGHALHDIGGHIDQLAPTERDDEFWFNDEHIVLRSNNVEFKVHSYLFARESEKARQLVEASLKHDERVVTFDDIPPQAIRCFLRVLYCRVNDQSTLSTKEDWTNVLHLSHLWDFSSIRTLAIDKLSVLTTAMDRIVLGHEYSVVGWLSAAYLDVCEQMELPSDEELERLDMKDLMRLMRAREAIRTPAQLLPLDVRSQKVDSLFELAIVVSIPEIGSASPETGDVSTKDPNFAQNSDRSKNPDISPEVMVIPDMHFDQERLEAIREAVDQVETCHLNLRGAEMLAASAPEQAEAHRRRAEELSARPPRNYFDWFTLNEALSLAKESSDKVKSSAVELVKAQAELRAANAELASLLSTVATPRSD